MRTNILAVDDNPMNLESTKELLESWGYRVDTAEKPSEALKMLQSTKEYSVLLLDYLMPEMDGAELAEKIRKTNDESVILMYSCEDSRDAIKESLRAQVMDFIDKDEDVPALKKAIESAVARYETLKTLRIEPTSADDFCLLKDIGLIGASPSMIKIATLAKRFRKMDNPVLITGETGTGKELIARALHDPSKGDFFAVNCAGFANSQLIESELFGYVKGAFTGANNSKAGILEIAKSGTVFLDELHHLSPAGQAAILRAVREHKIRRVGGDQEDTIRCRIIAATKPDIHQKAERQEFSPDLYYRLKMLLIEIPPLRERKEDIPLLVQYLADDFNQKNGTQKKFLARTVRGLEEYSWPGNIGELQGLIVNVMATTNKNTIEPRDLGPAFEQPMEEIEVTGFTLEDFESRQQREKFRFVEAVVRASESQRHAAKRLGISESTLRGHLERARAFLV
jgi:two-component system nitrogen regulation response regulator NtrX